MKQDHYEVLGVKRDATEDEIRAAARRAAAKAHPDREGGSDEQMAKINRARDVLMDAEARKRYDETGADPHERSPIDVATEALMDVFLHSIDAGAADIVAHARNLIREKLGELKSKPGMLAEQRQKIEAAESKVRRRKGAKGNRDLYTLARKRALTQIELQQKHIAEAIEITETMLKLVEDYETTLTQEELREEAMRNLAADVQKRMNDATLGYFFARR